MALKCDHCLSLFPEREAVHDNADGKKRAFCCTDCQGIFKLIHEERLDQFYNSRRWEEEGIPPKFLTKEIDVKPFAECVRDVETLSASNAQAGRKEITLFIEGIRCASCIWLNERILARTAGIEYARVNYATHTAKIRWNPEIIGLDKILKRIISIGYRPKPYSESERFRTQKAESRDLLIKFGTAAFLSSQLMIYSIALYAGYLQGIDRSIKLLLEVIAMLLTIPVVFYSGMPFIRGTLNGLKSLHFTMDSLITLGAGSAFIYSLSQIATGGKVYFDISAMIVTLVLLGRYIEINAKGKAAQTIEMLAELSPKEVRLLMDPATGSQEMIPVSSVKKGDLLQVGPGEKIPLDGIVTAGESEVDESLLTGESKPVHKVKGSGVIGGTQNLYGSLLFEVTKTREESLLSGIMRAVVEAQARKPKVQVMADKIVGVFVPAIIILAMMTVTTALLWGSSLQSALMTGIAVVVIACPCGLGLATPLAVLIFTTMASSKGIVIKSGEVIENMSRLTHVIFDKTGTVTIGRPVLKEIITLDPSLNKESALIHAAALEALSEHSLGHAIVEAAKEHGFMDKDFHFRPPHPNPLPRNGCEGTVGIASTSPFSPRLGGEGRGEGANLLKVSEFQAVPGQGIEGVVNGKHILIGNRRFMRDKGAPKADEGHLNIFTQGFESHGDTVVFMAWQGMIRSVFVISDAMRSETPEVVRALSAMGLDISIISGDNRATTASLASAAGIDTVLSEASPVKKAEVIHDLQKRRYQVMMVGDGINDAPPLTEASVGVAMGRGTDIALESAGVVLMRNDLSLVPYLIGLARKTSVIMRQNIFWAFFYNIIAIPLAVTGMLHPIIAAAAMAVSSLFVVGNSLRIRSKFSQGEGRAWKRVE